MSRTSKKNPVDSFDALVEQHQRGKSPRDPKPTSLPLQSIKYRPEVFQHRRPIQYQSDAHIRVLAEAAKVRDLDPVTVWWDGKSFTLIDGHHRSMGYITAGKGMSNIPVEVFEGTAQEALERAAIANTRAKLQMTPSEKSIAAWRLVPMTETMSKAKQSQAAGVSDGLVATMRRTKAKLLKQGMTSAELVELTWEAARRIAAGEENNWTPEEEDKRVAAMALGLRKALGATAERQPELFWKAIEVYSPQLAQGLLDHLDGAPEEDEADEESESA